MPNWVYRRPFNYSTRLLRRGVPLGAPPADITIEVPVASLTLTGFTPVPGENIVVEVPVASLTLTGFIPLPGENIVVDVPTASLTLTGFVPSVLENTIVNVPTGSLALTGFVPLALENTIIEVPTGSLTLTGFVPVVVENTVVEVPVSSKITIDNYIGPATSLTGLQTPNSKSAQSFTGDGNLIGKTAHRIRRVGNPTGTIFAEIFAHAGSFGTSSVGTGSALATSNTFNVADISTSTETIEFVFPTPFLTVDTTKYVVAVTVSTPGPDTSNRMLVEYDGSSPTHGGNLSRFDGSWVSLGSAFDMVFDVFTPGGLTLKSFAPVPGTDIFVPVPTAISIMDQHINPIDSSSDVRQPFTEEIGQSFTGNGKKIHAVTFRMYKAGTGGGGVMTAYIYAHTGTFGTSSLPTGAALATSNTVAVSSVTATDNDYGEDVLFTFPTPFQTVNGTKYVITWESLDGSSGNTMRYLITLTSGATHGGNLVDEDGGGWSATSGADYIFTVIDADTSLPLKSLVPVVLENTIINVPTGALTLTGFVPTPGLAIEVPVGTLTLTGFVPSILETIAVEVPTGSLALTGFAPTLDLSVEMPGALLPLTGFVPTIVTEEPVVIEVPTAALVITGLVPTIDIGIEVPTGTLTLASFAPTISITVEVPTASLTLTGLVPVLDLAVETPVGVLTLTGFIPVPGENIVVDIPVAGLTLTGFAPVVLETVAVSVPAGSLTLTGFVVVPGENVVVEVPVAGLTLTGFAPIPGENVVVDVPTATLTLTGLVPIALTADTVNVPTGVLTLTGFAPHILEDTVSVPAGVLTLTGFAPQININTIINVPTGTLNLTGFAVTLDEGISIPTASLALTGLIPTVVEQVVIPVPASALTLSGFAPLALQNHIIEIPSASLTLTGLVPTVFETENDINIEVPFAALVLTGLEPVGLIGGDGAVTPATGILTLIGFAPNPLSTIFNIESCDMDIIFAKPVDELIIPVLQDIEFNLDRLKNVELPSPIDVSVGEFQGFEPIAPSKEVDRINFLYEDFSSVVQDVIDGKIAELTNEVKPYDVETMEWARSKEDLLEDDEEAIERSFDDEASRGFVAPSGVFQKDISKQANKVKKKVSRANEAFFSGQNRLTEENISTGLEAGNRAENSVRGTDQNRQTINLQAAQFLTQIDFAVFELQVQKHNATLEVKRIKHQAYIAELRGQLLVLQDKEIAIKGHTLNLLERTKQIEMFAASVDYLTAQQSLKEIELDNFILQSEIERNKLLTFQAEVDKFSSLINLNISKFNLYKAGIDFEGSKVDQYQQEAAVADAQIDVQNAKTRSGRVSGNTKLTIARANLQAQIEKLRAARSRLDTALAESRAVNVDFSGDLLIYQAELREWLTEVSADLFDETTESEDFSITENTEFKDLNRQLVNIIEFDTEAQNIQDLATLNAEVISTSADITAKTEITSKLVHTLAGG